MRKLITCLGKIARAKLSMLGVRSCRERQCSSTENRRLASPQIMLSMARATLLLSGEETDVDHALC
jgi:hypothetical protein